MRRCGLALLLTASAVLSQPPRSAKDILSRVAAAYRTVPGYELQATIENRVAGKPAGTPLPQGVGSPHTTIAVAYSLPDRLMLHDLSTPLVRAWHDNGLSIFNGRGGGFVSSGTAGRSRPQPPPSSKGRPTPPGVYLPMPANLSPQAEAIIEIGYSDYTTIDKHVESAHVLREEKVTVDGGAFPCTVVEAAYAHKETRTFWVDDASSAVLREVDVRSENHATIEHTIQVTRLRWAVEVPDDVFHPERMAQNPSGTRPTPVPGSMPRCQLTTPEAKLARLSGMVMIEVSVDAAGNVLDARAPNPLGLGVDSVAIECARQAQWRPAQRDGKAEAGTGKMAMGVNPDSGSDWSLEKIEFNLPEGAERPHFVNAAYPAERVQQGQAEFLVTLTVDTAGKPQDVQVLSASDPKLAAKAAQIVRSWGFKPATSNGHPIEVPVRARLHLGRPGITLGH